MRLYYIVGVACLSFSFQAHGKAYTHPKEDLVINGNLNREEVVTLFDTKTNDISTCFKELQKKKPNARGQVTMELEVLQGKQRASTCKVHEDEALSDKAYRACLTKALCSITFPAPKLDTEILYLIKQF